MKKLKTIFLLVFGLCISSLSMQGQSVSGVVQDEDSIPLPGATVIKKGADTGVITDLDGNFSIDANNGDILTISYVGYVPQEITVGSGNVMSVTLSQDVTSFSDIVVTATRQPIRKIQSTTSITSIGEEELKSIQPESVAEALAYSPGVTVANSQGRKASYNIRGFPSGNTYVTTMLDGLPLNGFASRSAGQTEYLAFDNSIERVEVVRGSGATLFGRAAGAGAVNLIQRRGGDEMEGNVSFTYMNNVMNEGHPAEGDLDYRADFNVGGPIADGIKFGVGGYIMQDSGYKEWAQKDKGRQFSANVEFDLGDAVNLMVYGILSNNQFNNLTDSPFDLGKGEIADGWDNSNTFYGDNSQLDFESTLRTSAFAPVQFTQPILDVNGNEIKQNQADDNREEVIGGLGGLTASITLSDNITLVEKFRMSSYGWRDQNEVTFSSFYSAGDRILRLNANSNGDISDLINDLRLQISAGSGSSKHLFSVGSYYSAAKYDRFGGLHWYTADVNPRPTYGWFGPPGTPPPNVFSLSSTTSHQEENVLAFYAGDEMVFNDKLSVNVGFRWDRMTGFFNNDPEEIDGLDYDPAELDENELDFSNWSGSIGANYLLAPRTAIYGSFVRAFSLPSVGLNTPLPEKDEIVWNTEIGARFGLGDLGVDIGLFNTTINNRVAVVFNPNSTTGQTFIPVPVGDNTVTGAELQLTYAPQSVKGLILRGSLTLQNSQYKADSDGNGFEIALGTIDDDGDDTTPEVIEADLDNLFGLNVITSQKEGSVGNQVIDVSGNQVQGTPNLIYSLVAGYNTKSYGVSFDMVTYAGRYASALNLIETPDLTVANANAYYRFGLSNGSGLRLGIRVKNLFDSNGVQQLMASTTEDDALILKQNNPNYTDVLTFGIIQIPRRVLLTLGYDF